MSVLAAGQTPAAEAIGKVVSAKAIVQSSGAVGRRDKGDGSGVTGGGGSAGNGSGNGKSANVRG